MIKPIIILIIIAISLVVFFYPRKQCGCNKKHTSEPIENSYSPQDEGDNNSYSDYLEQQYFHKQNEHPLPNRMNNLVGEVFPNLYEGFESNNQLNESNVLFSSDETYTFNKTNQNLSSAENLKLTEEFTVMVWVKQNEPSRDWVRIIGKGNRKNRNFGIWIRRQNSRLLSQIYGVNGGGIHPTKNLPLNKWCHLACTFKKGDKHILYLNGEKIGETPTRNTPKTSNDPLTIGGANFHTKLVGEITKPFIFNRVLNIDEIKEFSENKDDTLKEILGTHIEPNYDCQSYLDRYPDLQDAFGKDCSDKKIRRDVFRHWKTWGKKEGRDASKKETVVPEEEAVVIPEEEEVVIPEEEQGNINTIREKAVYKVIAGYIRNNAECVLPKNKKLFDNALENYMIKITIKLLGLDKFKDMNGFKQLSEAQFKQFISMLSKMPKCNTLLSQYGQTEAPKKKLEKQDISTTIKETKTDNNIKSTVISSKSEGNIPTITTIINTNRGTVQDNPHGDRRLAPKNAPYLYYFNKITQKLNDLSIKIDGVNGIDNTSSKNANAGDEVNTNVNKISNVQQQVQDNKKDISTQVQSNVDNRKQSVQNNVNNKRQVANGKVDNAKYIKQEQTIKNNIETQKVQLQNTITSNKTTKQQEAEQRVENANQKLYVNAENTSNKMFNDRENVQDIGANFNYKPNVSFNHQQPSRKIMSAYGWSYMPPQAWSVPQKRPPVCIPDKDTQATVKPIFDKGTPVDAMSWTQANNLLPKTEYTEEYNANYYYPGWIAQDKVKYPIDKAGNNSSSEYYNYNLAKKIE